MQAASGTDRQGPSARSTLDLVPPQPPDAPRLRTTPRTTRMEAVIA